ncbi:endonuclease [Flavobacterium sp. WW92]|uniref:endonuclease n=1 Tax=unclassified Flavobacterium TaxID=196869 RepID=UPI0022241975|nr:MULTISPECIES: endonuclease [unclassified Flavobacterium]WDO12423.1 endonuclease [Flavobacterium sp. WW92]
MIKNYLSILFLFISVSFSYGQVVINELDSDTPGIDDKEFVELKSTVPNFSLDGYVLVFFNGNAESASTGNKSYLTISLNGLTTDANGLVLIGCNAVSPVPQKIMGDNLIQNGADAVAIYQGTVANFPDGTLATTTSLIDALAYDTNDADATALMGLLGLSIQINEDENNQGVNQSIQRKPDGTYEVKAPTPGANNDGSGIIFNGIGISVPALQYTEGNSFTITFTTQTPVTSDLAFTYTLANGSFTAADFTANTNVLIPTGSTTFMANVQLVDDAIDEGDELMKIKLGNLPAGYIRLNDNIEIRILDNDFTVSPWGTPLNPTHGIVTSTAPAGYYDSLEGKSGAVLKQAVQDIIANPAVVRAHNYGDITNILKVADQNPLNSNEVWLMYKEVSRSKFLFQDTGSGTGRWNREHIYPQSRGGFADGTSDTPDGINVWEPTSASMLNHGHADAHHLRAEDGPENSSRNNKDFGLTDYNGFSGNAGSWKGDVARAVFYMAIRYNGLDVVNGNPPDTTVGQLGDLATLLQWNVNDPSDDFEMNRNNYIYTWQQNRNPFIDYPYLADYIWGSRAGQAFSLSTPDFSELKVAIYPNPAKNYITVAGITSSATLQLFSVSGQELLTADFSGTSTIQLNLAPGMYLAKIISENRTAVRKIIIQ